MKTKSEGILLAIIMLALCLLSGWFGYTIGEGSGLSQKVEWIKVVDTTVRYEFKPQSK